MKRKLLPAAVAALAVLAQGCAGTTGGVTPPSNVQAFSGAGAPMMTDAASGTVSLAALPLDDYDYSKSAKVGYVYVCSTTFGGGGASGNDPWIDTAANTFDLLTKAVVEGAVSWSSKLTETISGTKRDIVGNGLPSHVTGVYPIAKTDPAHEYDGNPNSIKTQNVSLPVPSNPTVNATPTCLGMGAIGVMNSGAQLYNALDALGRDAVAHEVLDSCSGHPDESGTYHYHSLSSCISDPGTGHSNLLGYAKDGFGIYGERGENGVALTDADLDVCHGHTHAITWNGKTVTMYHYHMTSEYPYSLGCYRGTPI